MVIAFTAASPKEGVSHVVRSLGAELVRYTGKRTLIVDAQRLQRLQASDPIRMSQHCVETEVANLWIMPPDEGVAAMVPDEHQAHLPASARQHEQQLGFIEALRVNFDHVLIDCPSLKTSYMAAMLAPHVDGLVLVVEADHTKRDQIQRAQQLVETADGRLLGLVLNKRQYPVPDWLYKRL
ncbi:tyrosine-protein kinase [soil metagenome]